VIKEIIVLLDLATTTPSVVEATPFGQMESQSACS
jgi:hypothetical protein